MLHSDFSVSSSHGVSANQKRGCDWFFAFWSKDDHQLGRELQSKGYDMKVWNVFFQNETFLYLKRQKKNVFDSLVFSATVFVAGIIREEFPRLLRWDRKRLRWISISNTSFEQVGWEQGQHWSRFFLWKKNHLHLYTPLPSNNSSGKWRFRLGIPY